MKVITRKYTIEYYEDRLDIFLAGRDTGLTRSQVRRLIEEGCVLLNGSSSKASHKLRPGDRVLLNVPPQRPSVLEPEYIPINIVYEDKELLVVDKPAGLTVHPAPGHPSHTLVNAVLALCPDLRGIGGTVRPGIVHRLDKDTSGLMVVAKSDVAHQGISLQIKERLVRKVYLGLTLGRVEPAEGYIQAPIGRDPRNRKRMAVIEGGRDSSTRYKVLDYFDGYSFVEIYPETGRTHQIRVHFAYKGYPLVGDAVYGGKSPLVGRQFLHAHRLEFSHPTTGEFVQFTSPLPAELHDVILVLSHKVENNYILSTKFL